MMQQRRGPKGVARCQVPLCAEQPPGQGFYKVSAAWGPPGWVGLHWLHVGGLQDVVLRPLGARAFPGCSPDCGMKATLHSTAHTPSHSGPGERHGAGPTPHALAIPHVHCLRALTRSKGWAGSVEGRFGFPQPRGAVSNWWLGHPVTPSMVWRRGLHCHTPQAPCTAHCLTHAPHCTTYLSGGVRTGRWEWRAGPVQCLVLHIGLPPQGCSLCGAGLRGRHADPAATCPLPAPPLQRYRICVTHCSMPSVEVNGAIAR